MAKEATKVKKEKPRNIKLERVGAKLAKMYDSKNYDKKQMTIFARDTLLSIRDVLISEAKRPGEAKLSINGFGTFGIIIKKARKARNPKTGETINVPEKKSVNIKISSAIKRRVAEAGNNGLGKSKSKKKSNKK